MKTNSKEIFKWGFLFSFFCLCMSLIIISFFSLQDVILLPLSPTTPTPDSRPRISGCLNWKDLDWLEDLEKDLCVYGYKGRYTYKDAQIGEHWEFHTKPNFQGLEDLGELGFNNEIRHYYVHIHITDYPFGLVSNSEKEMWRHSEYPELYRGENNCIAVGGELKVFNWDKGFKKHWGYIIIVTNPDKVFNLNNCG